MAAQATLEVSWAAIGTTRLAAFPDICGEAFMLTSSRRVQVKVKTPPFFMAIVGCDWHIIAMEIGGSHGIADPKGFGGPDSSTRTAKAASVLRIRAERFR
jgi:hypothetical protein